MKRSIFLTILVVSLACLGFSLDNSQPLTADNVTGAWQLSNDNEEQVLLFMDGYFTHTSYDKAGKKFIQTRGGTYSVAENQLSVQYEFDTRDKEKVGQTATYQTSLQGKQLTATLNGKPQTWTKLDDGSANLAGLWKITARKQGDGLQPIHQTGTRKTVKILTSTRFQWAAIDPGNKSFMGTGGGTYTFKDGKYTESIEFFSRDSSRVGASLTFNGKLENGDWHHSGLSSRGEPIYEVWSRKK